MIRLSELQKADAPPPEIFIAYSSQDESWKERLASRLRILGYKLTIRNDRQLAATTPRDAAITVIVLSNALLTSSFLLRKWGL